MDPKLKKAFPKDTGIALTYDEDINSNNEYFAKIRPNLSKHQSIGQDGFVLTDWMANRLINQVKWVEPFVDAKFPNKANLRQALKSPGFDPTRKYSAPWASGVTGIAYNIGITKKEIQTIDEFLAVQGTTTVLDEMRDTVGLFMRVARHRHRRPRPTRRPSPRSTSSQAAFDDNKIDGTNGNEYVNDLGNGNLAAAFAWSGDVAQITHGQSGRALRGAGLGRDALVRQLHDPVHDRQGRPRERVHQLLLRARERGDPHGVHPVHLAGRGRARGAHRRWAATPRSSSTTRW